MAEGRDTSVFRTPDGRPNAGPPTLGVEGEISLLRELLQVERDRLTVAREIERERGIVFPETTVIVRDIERLLGKVRAYELAEGPPVPVAPAAAPPPPPIRLGTRRPA